jgi:hypothetical protein
MARSAVEDNKRLQIRVSPATKDERAARWYRSYGATPVLDQPLTLVMPLATFAPSLRSKGLLGS